MTLEPGQAEALQLDNGLTILLENIPYRSSVTAGIWNPVGSRFESENEMGYSHFTEHMLFKGTKNRTYSQISREIDRLGGYINASTSKELTNYYISISTRHLPVALDVLSDIFFESAFPEKEFGVEKKVILEEIKMGEDSPDDYLFDCFYKDAFGDNGMGRPIAGTLDSIGASTRDQLYSYFQKFYGTTAAVLSLAGMLWNTQSEKEALLETIKKFFEKEKKQSKAGFDSLKEKYTVSNHVVKHHHKELEQAHFAFGLPGLSHRDETPSLRILTHLLGGSMSSRLFSKMREERGLCYSVGTFHSKYYHEGLWGVYCGTSPSTFVEAVQVMREELQAALDGKLEDEEIIESQNGIIGMLELSNESSMRRASRNAKNWLYEGRLIPFHEEVSRLEDVTPDEVRVVAAELWKGQRGTLTSLGSMESSEVDKALSKII